MPPILIYFGVGLTLALLVGVASYFTVGRASTPLFTKLFGRQGGPMWGRLYRVALVGIALGGGLSVKFYGCSGPTDYQAVARSRDLMLKHTAEQAASSMDYEVTFLLFSAAVAAAARPAKTNTSNVCSRQNRTIAWSRKMAAKKWPRARCIIQKIMSGKATPPMIENKYTCSGIGSHSNMPLF